MQHVVPVKTIVDSAWEIRSLHARCGGLVGIHRWIRVPHSFWNTARDATDDRRLAFDAGFVRVTPVEVYRQRSILRADRGRRRAGEQAPVLLHQNRLCPEVNIPVRSFLELQDAVGDDIHVAVSIHVGGTDDAMAVDDKISVVPEREWSAIA